MNDAPISSRGLGRRIGLSNLQPPMLPDPNLAAAAPSKISENVLSVSAGSAHASNLQNNPIRITVWDSAADEGYRYWIRLNR